MERKTVKKKILITGGSGFIGSNLCKHFNRGYTVSAPKHTDLDLLNTEAVERYFKRHPIDVVINCAVVGGSRIEEQVGGSVAINVRMFFNIARCKQYFGKMIHMGSGAEYDKSKPLKQIKEEEFGKRIPTDEYGFYKYVCGQYIEASRDPIVSLRIFGLFGTGEDYRLRFISNMIVQILSGNPLVMNQDAYFDYVYVKDFARIVEHFIEHNGNYRSYNIGTGKRLRLSHIAQKIRAMAKATRSITVKHSGFNKEYTCDTRRLRDELGDFQFTDLDVALRELYDWYKANKIRLDPRFRGDDKP